MSKSIIRKQCPSNDLIESGVFKPTWSFGIKISEFLESSIFSSFKILIPISVAISMALCARVISKKIAIEATLLGKIMIAMYWIKQWIKYLVFIKYGGILLVLYFVFKLIFPEINSNFGLNAGLIIFPSNTGGFIIRNCCSRIYFFPTVIQIFYRVKYSEKLRNFESKTQVEWYGEKYFLKHIKGTDKEQKNE